MKHLEANLQTGCVTYFRLRYPDLSGVFFAVPNGGHRNAIEARNLKYQGTLSGVSDLILLKPVNGYGSLCIEMKAGAGKQTEYQQLFQKSTERHGNKYVVCRTFDEFRSEIEKYLNAGNS